MTQWAPTLAAVLAFSAALFAARASTRATRVNEDVNRLKWVQEAKSEATAAKAEREAAAEQVVEIRRELTLAKREAIELRDTTEELTRWIYRVVDWAADPTVADPELRRLINGGPASLRTRKDENR